VVASLHVFLRDTAQFVSVLLTFWFWVTPVFVDPAKYPGWGRFLFAANPLYYLVSGYRSVLLGTGLPNLRHLAVGAAFGAVAFILGGLFFRYMKRGFADVL